MNGADCGGVDGIEPDQRAGRHDDAAAIGAGEIDEIEIVEQPADADDDRIVSDEEIKAELAAEQPYQEWLEAGQFHLDDLPQGDYVRMPHHRVVLRQQAFGFTYEELNLLVAPMARNGAEALGSMGTDTPVAVLSARPRMLYDYFQQLFAQVTNPPLDAIREEVVTSLQGSVRPGGLRNPNADSCRQIILPNPILRNAEMSKLICVDPDHEVRGHKHGLRAAVSVVSTRRRGGQGLKEALDDVRGQGDIRDQRWRTHHRAVRP